MLDELTRGKFLGLLTSRKWRKVMDTASRSIPLHELAYAVNEVAGGAVKELLAELDGDDRQPIDVYVDEMDTLQKGGGDPCRLAALRTVLYALARMTR